jgi:hypothetical protein
MEPTVKSKTDRHQAAPFPFRMSADVKAAALKAKVAEERSLNWILNDRLKAAFGLKKVA